MIRDPDRFSKICSGVQSIVVSAALLVGGFWTLYTFNTLREINKSQSELHKLELETREQAAVSTDIRASQIMLPGDHSRYVAGEITIKNDGNRNARIEFSANPFVVTQTFVNEAGKQEFGKRFPATTFREDELSKPAGGTNVRSGASSSYPFLVRVTDPGLYLITFSAQIGVDELKEIPAEKKPFWGASRFVIVK